MKKSTERKARSGRSITGLFTGFAPVFEGRGGAAMMEQLKDGGWLVINMAAVKKTH